MLRINDNQAYREYKEYLAEDQPKKIEVDGNIIRTEDFEVIVEPRFERLLEHAKKQSSAYGNDLIFGKDLTEKITHIEVKDDQVYIFKHNEETEIRPVVYWILAPRKLDKKFTRLKGNNYYKYIRTFDKAEDFAKYRNIYKKKDIYSVWNKEESQMIYHGLTQFKGLKVEDLSILSFDIEASGIVRDNNSEIYVITNTFYKDGEASKRQFREDNYENQGEMLQDWCEYVRELDPDILTGHNLFGYDLDFMRHVAELNRVELILGRDGSAVKFGKKPKKYRVDGAQTWDYMNCRVFGRHIIDGMFLSVKYGVTKSYPSWKLKDIIEYEGLVKEGRQFYDAAKIRDNWPNLVEREKIVNYCEDDGDDSLALYHLMIPSFFYLTRSIPKPFQVVINSASGSWLNALFVRGYLQQGESIPKAEEIEQFEGAISYGVPGVYSNCFKQDVASLYPSIMREYEVCDERKDYLKTFPDVVEYFTLERLKNKKIANETGDKYYRALEQSQKIVINSLYGFMGAPGLNFNSGKMAAFVTEKGRDILNKAMKWATGEEIDYWKERVENPENVGENSGKYNLVNCDTDSIMISKKDQSHWTPEEREKFLEAMNKEFPELIVWEDDGYYERAVIVKAKNYVLKEEGKDKLKFKGSCFKSANKEKALVEMLNKIAEDLIEEKDWYPTYEKYLEEVANIEDISRWATKVSITEKLIEGDTTDKQRKLEALKDFDYQIGDKVHLFKIVDGERPKLKKGEKQYYKKTGELMTEPNDIWCMVENFDNKYMVSHYVKRIYKTLEILQTVIDISRSPRYDLTSKFKEYEKDFLK